LLHHNATQKLGFLVAKQKFKKQSRAQPHVVRIDLPPSLCDNPPQNRISKGCSRHRPLATIAIIPFEAGMSAEDVYINLRRFPRRKCFVGVELRPHGTGACVLGSLVTISRGGCCVEAPALIDVGASLEIAPMDGARSLKVQGKVVNQTIRAGTLFHALGIEFTDPPDAANVASFEDFAQKASVEGSSGNWYLRQAENG